MTMQGIDDVTKSLEIAVESFRYAGQDGRKWYCLLLEESKTAE